MDGAPIETMLNGLPHRMFKKKRNHIHNWFFSHLASGTWEPNTFKVFDKYIRPGSAFIDIGAWIGPTAIYGARIAGKCIAIEPDPDAFEQLLENIQLNSLTDKISALNIAISDINGPLSMGTKGERGDSCSSIFNKGDSWITEGVTLETLISQSSITDVSFIKMDIEGAEAIVIPGNKTFFETYKPTIFLSLHYFAFPNRKYDLEAIIDSLGHYKWMRDSKGMPLSRPDILGDQNIKGDHLRISDILFTNAID